MNPPIVPRQIATAIITSTAPQQTATATVTSTAPAGPAPTTASLPSGPKSGPLLFIILITILGTLLVILIGTVVYSYRTRKRRRAAVEAASLIAGQELQPAAPVPANGNEIQSPAEREVHGYYAPPGQSVIGNEMSEQEAAAREAYGYFSPTVAPRVGDGVVVQPRV